ncbi:NAC domain-containing protein 35 [Trifolium pratense]|nr:NAC domain-containing protein 35 [Trifolium pratense]
MAIARAVSPTMSMRMSLSHSHEDGNNNTTTTNSNDSNTKATTVTAVVDDDDDDHEHDLVMPGFRFHPTEEELVEFYLRRKVEGKRFNVELITFLDLYRYDPWELPALAAIGEKEWYFYVPRDRKYRNGDRPNRVTTSGYWKATGADRMIRTENFRSIGLKKTLVFYSGKAPKGIRTSWIMNEYRLPQHETERYQKGEISLCRVYKRAGVEDHPSLPRCLPITRPSSARGSSHNNSDKKQNEILGMGFVVGQSSKTLVIDHDDDNDDDQILNKMDGGGSSSAGATHGNSSDHDHVTTALGLSKYSPPPPPHPHNYRTEEEEQLMMMQHQQAPRQLVQYAAAAGNSLFVPAVCGGAISTSAAGASCSSNNGSTASAAMMMDELNRLVSYQQQQQYCYNVQNNIINPPNPNPNNHHFSTLLMQPMSLPNQLPAATATTFSDRLWDWNPIPEDHNHNHPNSSSSNTTSFK